MRALEARSFLRWIDAFNCEITEGKGRCGTERVFHAVRRTSAYPLLK